MSAVRRQGDDLLLACHLQPRASANGWAGLHGDALKIRITAAPVDGAANDALIRFLASAFGVPRARIVIEQGQASRRKRVRIQSPATLPELVREALAG